MSIYLHINRQNSSALVKKMNSLAFFYFVIVNGVHEIREKTEFESRQNSTPWRPVLLVHHKFMVPRWHL